MSKRKNAQRANARRRMRAEGKEIRAASRPYLRGKTAKARAKEELVRFMWGEGLDKWRRQRAARGEVL